ncbi:DUF6307 family protein [Amycolatopsis japonica]|uniref:DUF6307 family protein n=1 Tax=Amycolatopsis TaxID=1813 RepID=UPI002265D50E|nr:DUF6307 family protein [Amycolatopsis japonica]
MSRYEQRVNLVEHTVKENSPLSAEEARAGDPVAADARRDPREDPVNAPVRGGDW